MKAFKYVNYLILAITLGAVAGLFFLLGPEEKSNLFYTNLGLAALADLLFFGAIFIVAQKKNYTIQGVAFAKQIMTYGIWLAVVIVLYNVIIQFYPIDFKWYIAAVIILTVIYLIIVIAVAQGGQAQIENAEKIENLRTTSQQEIRKMPRIHDQFSTAITGCGAEVVLQEKVKKSMRILYETATFIPADFYAKNPGLFNDIFYKFETLKQEFEALHQIEEALLEKHLESINNAAKEITEYIKTNK